MPRTEPKRTIAIDIDEVLFPMANTFLEWHNSEYGTDFTLDQMTSYYVEDLTGETEEAMLLKIKAYLDTEHYKQGKPLEGTVDAIHKLKKKFKLAIITSRDHFYRPSTKRFLESHFGGLYDELYYTHTVRQLDLRLPKHIICEEIGAFALVDDHLNHIIAAAEHGLEGVLFGNYAWNQANELPSGVTRVNNWQEALEYFDAKN